MLINQNHEMSIKLKKKNAIIEKFRNMVEDGNGEKKDSQRTSTNYPNEDNSFDSNIK